MIEGEWLAWFAWRPVEVAGRRAWLRWIERRVDRIANVGGIFDFESFRETGA